MHSLASTYLQIPGALGIIAIITIVCCVTVILLKKYASRKSEKKKTAAWLLKNDDRVSQIIIVLSHFPKRTLAKKGLLNRKKSRLYLEMYLRVKDSFPDANSEEVQQICKDLILVSDHVRKKREKQ